MGTAAGVAVVAAATSPEPRRLRVGLFLDSRLQPRWAIDAFLRIARSEFAEISLIAVAGGTRAAEPLVWKLYGDLDRWAFGADDLGACSDLPAEVPHRKFLPLGASEMPRVALDVAFALGEFDDRALDGLAVYGVWRFHFGAGARGSEAAAGWREVAEGAPLSASGLTVRLAAGSASRFAYRSWSRTYALSVARNRAQLLRKTAEFAWRSLRELHRSGHGWLDQCKPCREVEGSAACPGNADLLRKIPAIAGRIAQRGVQKALTVEQWFLAYRLRESRFADARSVPADLAGFQVLMPPKDRYWADPFVLSRNGRYFVFFEELPFKAKRAHISMVEIDSAGRASRPVAVLQRDYHLSYPFLVEDDGQLYMIPESARNGTVEAWRCIDFPLRWKLERVLLPGVRCVDATFYRGPDRWWMFANVAARDSRMFDDELHLFHADRLLGDWQPHRRNPVKSDARCARPAGQLYWKNGALHRPAQICAPLYGSGLSINRVMRLTPHQYAERQVERILPSGRDGLYGVHTINRAGELTVIDAFRRGSRF